MKYNNILLLSPRLSKGRHRLSIHPLAGLGYIAESLLHSGIKVRVIDMNLGYSLKDVLRCVDECSPDLIGFSVMTFGYRQVYSLAKIIKELFPHITIACGGPHVSMLRKQILLDSAHIDYGFILEGDRSFVSLCKGEEPQHVPGVLYRKNGEVLASRSNDFVSNLDTLAFPRYESFELSRYPTRQIGIVTSRGCPYGCIYCPVASAIGRKFRQRSARSVVEEIEYWYMRGYREILILDDNFTFSRKRTEEICDLLGSRALKDIQLKCPNGIRADKVDYALLKQMRSTGFNMIAFGVEAGTDKVLKNIKKDESIAQIEQSISDACRLGFEVDLFFLVGSPGEAPEDLDASFSLALRYPIRNANFYNIVPFPTTELFDWLKDNEYFLHPLEYILNNSSHFINEPCFFTPEMSEEERRKAFRKARNVSKKVKARYFQQRIPGPLFIRKTISIVYAYLSIEKMINNNALLLKLKEKFKRHLSKKGLHS